MAEIQRLPAGAILRKHAKVSVDGSGFTVAAGYRGADAAWRTAPFLSFNFCELRPANPPAHLSRPPLFEHHLSLY